MPLIPPHERPSDRGTWKTFVETVRAEAGPLARQLRCALGVARGEELEVLAAGPDCPCLARQLLPRPDDCPVGRACLAQPLVFQDRPFGQLWLCSDRQTTEVAAALTAQVRGILRRIELEKGEEALLQELSMSWESLEAVYEISSHTRSGEKTGELLERILERAVVLHEGSQAILWLESGGRLEPTAARATQICQPRPIAGLLGKALTERAGMIINGHKRIVALAEHEPELARARSVVFAPTATRQGLRAVLEIWQEDGHEDYDSRTMHLADTLALQAIMVIENERLHRESLESERLRADLEIGSRIQQTLLIGLPPGELLSLQVAALSVPSRLIDGDFYDFFKHADGSLDVLLGDVMGKGIPAALVGAATKNQFLRSLSKLFSAQPQELPRLEDVLTSVRRELAQQLITLDSFVTLCYTRFDLRQRRLELIDCGHTRSLHYLHSTRQVQFLQGDSLPLGWSLDEVYQPLTVPLAVGDLFFFYSDGVTEARRADGELFGEERLADLIRRHGAGPPERLIEQLRITLAAFSGADTFADDLSCVVVAIKDLDGR